MGNSQNIGSALNNPATTEWDKLNSLKHIEMLRETKKHTLLDKVLKESLATYQIIDVVTG